MMTIDSLTTRVFATNSAKGWHDCFARAESDAELADQVVIKLALVTTEVAEAIEEVRDLRFTETYYSGADNKPEGLPSELADIIIRTVDIAAVLNINLEEALREKLAFNDRREYKHGGRAL